MKTMIQSLTDTVQKLESKVNSQTLHSTHTRGNNILTIDKMHHKIDLTTEIMVRVKYIKIHIENQVTLEIISIMVHKTISGQTEEGVKDKDITIHIKVKHNKVQIHFNTILIDRMKSILHKQIVAMKII